MTRSGLWRQPDQKSQNRFLGEAVACQCDTMFTGGAASSTLPTDNSCLFLGRSHAVGALDFVELACELQNQISGSGQVASHLGLSYLFDRNDITIPNDYLGDGSGIVGNIERRLYG